MGCRSNSKAVNEPWRQTLLADTGTQVQCLRFFDTPDGTPCLSWVEVGAQETPRLLFTIWEPQTGRFADPVPVPMEAKVAIHEEGMPKLVFKGEGTIMVLYETSTASKEHRFGIRDLRFRISEDGGKSWSKPRSMGSKRRPSDSQSFASITRLADGEVGVVWLDTDPQPRIPGSRPVYFARSAGRDSFSSPLRVDHAACPCCRTAILPLPNGQVLLAYRDLDSNSHRDISLVWLSEEGTPLVRQAGISMDEWKVDGCPHLGPSLARGDTTVFLTWYTGASPSGLYIAEICPTRGQIQKRRLSSQAKFASPSVHPDGTPWVVFSEPYKMDNASYSRIQLSQVNGQENLRTEISSPRAQATHPVLYIGGKAKTYRLAAWIEEGKVVVRELPESLDPN